MNRIHRFKVLGMLAVPIAAIAVLAVFLSFNLLSNSKHAAANQPNAAVHYTLHIGAVNSGSLAAVKGAAVVSTGSQFAVSVSLDTIPGPYDAIAVTLKYSGSIKGKFETAAKPGPKIAGHWPDCAFEAIAPASAGSQNVGCAVAASSTGSTYTGDVFATTLTCATAGAGEVHLLHGGADPLVLDHAGKTSTDGTADVINVTCANATATFTPTATATQPPIPRVFKTCSATGATLCNIFLTRQGSKIPPSTCAAGTSGIKLNEQINIPVSSINSKGEHQTLAAFQFEVRYSNKDVCVFLTPAGNFTGPNPNVICTVRDDSNSTLKGIAQIGCVTIGKGHTGPATNLQMATITVKPQPEVFSQLRPNQENGVTVQILNQGCNLADEQGIAIPIFSCEDADLTFRFLEGDVDGPDCKVDVFDTQNVAFRWGADKGNLLFNSFMDLSPSGHGVNGDGHIDIQDIQFVFGRFGSTGSAQKGSTGPCPAVGHPWPPQLPVNPKAGGSNGNMDP